jgi:20S proteasome alpha/beta subunit
VTIIVGIICKDAIVLASDSQTSYYPSTQKRCDTDKVCAIKFKDGKEFLVAQAGDATLSSRAIEILSNSCADGDFVDYRKPADLAELAIKQIKSEVATLNHWTPGDESAVDFAKNSVFSLMLAYFFEERPLIFAIDSWPGFATQQHDYATLGCGSTVAEFILSRSKVSDMKMGMAVMTAIYTVEEVKRVDSFCGGQTKIATIKPHAPKAVVAKGQRALDLINSCVESMAKHEEKSRDEWRAMMDTIADDAMEKFHKKYPLEKESK